MSGRVGEGGGHAGGGLLRAVEEAGEVEHDFGAEDGFDLLVRAFEGLEQVEHEDERVDGHGLGEEFGVLLCQGAQVDLLVGGQAVYLEHDRVPFWDSYRDGFFDDCGDNLWIQGEAGVGQALGDPAAHVLGVGRGVDVVGEGQPAAGVGEGGEPPGGGLVAGAVDVVVEGDEDAGGGGEAGDPLGAAPAGGGAGGHGGDVRRRRPGRR